MLATPPHNVAEAIVTLFSRGTSLSAYEIHSHIVKRHFKCSQRSIYKELNALIEKGVLLKVHGRYQPSLTWVLNLIEFGESLYSRTLKQREGVEIVPERGERKRWQFRDLQHLDRLWLQAIFALFEISQSRRMYAWVPYFWFDLVHYEKDLEAQQAMMVAGNKMYLILGGKTYLDQLPLRYWSKQAYDWSYAEGPFENERDTYYDVIDDYILTVKIDGRTTRRIDDFFRKVRNARDLMLLPEFERIKREARASLTIEKSPLRAQRLRRKFLEFFGE